MKKIQQILNGRAGIIGMVCLLAATLSSCVKNHDDYVDTPAALVSVINTSPNSLAQDVYFDSNMANHFGPIAYGDGIDYVRAYTGKRNISFYNGGTQTKIKTDTATFKADRYYSVYLANLPNSAEIVTLTDTVKQPAAGMASIRLVNLSTDAGAVDLVVNSKVLAANKNFKGFSGFVPLTGDTNYTLEIHKTGTAIVLASLTNVKLRAGSIYTIWLQGLTAATDQAKLSAGIQNNVYFY